ncbi:MAG TPA: hypothetical protein ENK28_03475 [Aliiroseovarius sp.]|nr:hypothetical protein [Aliiroseovarius sp.]
MKQRPITSKVKRLRQRQRADGSWAVWWEPEAAVVKLGFARADLDPARPTWSVRQAEQMNRQVDLARAGGSAPSRRGKTIDDLIHNYRQKELPKKSQKTQASYNSLLNLISQKWGRALISEFDKPTMRIWYETLYDSCGLRQAVALIRMMSGLFSRAELIGWRAENTNPCFRLKMDTPKPRSRCASWAEIDALCDAADAIGAASMRTAIKISVFQGQRAGDVRRAQADDFSQVTVPLENGGQETVWVWSLMRSKRGTQGMMRLHPEVAPLVAAIKQNMDDGQQYLLIDEATGTPYTEDRFSKRFASVRAAAARNMPSVSSLNFRDFRRTFAMFARAAGINKDDAADVLGNSAATNWQLGETYMPPQFETASRAVMAIRRPEQTKRKKA